MPSGKSYGRDRLRNRPFGKEKDRLLLETGYEGRSILSDDLRNEAESANQAIMTSGYARAQTTLQDSELSEEGITAEAVMDTWHRFHFGKDMLECYMCGTPADKEDAVCRYCGASMTTYRMILDASDRAYNEGLSKAKSRDLSGAISDLSRALRYNKKNTKAVRH